MDKHSFQTIDHICTPIYSTVIKTRPNLAT